MTGWTRIDALGEWMQRRQVLFFLISFEIYAAVALFNWPMVCAIIILTSLWIFLVRAAAAAARRAP